MSVRTINRRRTTYPSTVHSLRGLSRQWTAIVLWGIAALPAFGQFTTADTFPSSPFRQAAWQADGASPSDVESEKSNSTARVASNQPAITPATTADLPLGSGLPGAVGPMEQRGEWAIEPEVDWGMGGGSCPSRWYLIGEAFALDRRGGSRETLSQAMRLPNWDYELNYRATVGFTRDCLDGWEVSYVGGGRWRESSEAFGADLDSWLTPGFGVVAGDLSAFNDADHHYQEYKSEMHSFEANRRWWGWDVFSVRAGVRYMHFDDEFTFMSENGFDLGLFNTKFDNDLIMPQVGIDLMRPLGRLTMGGKIVGAVGINFNDGDYTLINAGSPLIANSSESEEFCYLVEVGSYAYYRIAPRITARIGYESWFIGGLALAENEIYSPVSSLSGLGFDEHGKVFVHGGTAGIEFVW